MLQCDEVFSRANLSRLALRLSSGRIPGELIWGMIDLDAAKPQFEISGRAPLTYEGTADRAAADLYVTQVAANKWDIFSVATSDPGDFGPFRSAVYLAGTFSDFSSGVAFTSAAGLEIVYWDFTGLKWKRSRHRPK